jgi:hypothetical protein
MQFPNLRTCFAACRQHAESVDISGTYARLR